MAKRVTIDKENLQHSLEESQEHYCKELEAGNILFLPFIPFDFPEEDLQFLLKQRQTEAKNHKNIAYKPKTNSISNALNLSQADAMRLLGIMRRYSECCITFLSQLLSPYAQKWQLDYASFRPFQEKGRVLRTRARNDLLHVDSFPTRPMKGNRILRFFTNINPLEARHWITSEPFDVLAERFGGSHVPFSKRVWTYPFLKLAKSLGLPVTLRSPYDTFMLNLHNFLKENEEFQRTCPKDHWEFPPHCCWIVFTDQVSHAALAGQYALEQTVVIPYSALVEPQRSPLAVLERLACRRMTNC